MEALKTVVAVVYGLASGAVISAAVFAFISAIGVVPRLAQKTGCMSRIKVFESAIMLGGIFGATLNLFEFSISAPAALGALMLIAWGLSAGIFYGCLAMSLAEVLDVIPILARRTRIKYGLRVIVISIACGKTVGALLYFLVINT
ncbi:MAG: stage V sporulation protein AB [Defluviitaleaceae bacterium]|nr:stage V sporulation protein AB [Defluviitaleaceae bacterium]